MWRVYKQTGTDKDYDAYKEALHAATNEVRKSKRNCEHKLAQNIKSDSNSIQFNSIQYLYSRILHPYMSFYAYVYGAPYMYEVSKMLEIRLDHWRTMLEI